MRFPSRAFLGLLWCLGLMALGGLLLYPLSTATLRVLTVGLAACLWLGLLIFSWPHNVSRWLVIVATILLGLFLLGPGRPAETEHLRADYTAALQHYRGCPYAWGGESPLGIDCSGLVRRGLVDALFYRGLITFNPALLRAALSLWWHDSTARDLGSGHGATCQILDIPSINSLDHAGLLPGDLAVTSSGLHILAYLGDHRWIDADPSLQKVVIFEAPTTGTAWAREPVKIVRWRLLQP